MKLHNITDTQVIRDTYSIQNSFFFAGEMLSPSYSWKKIAIKHTHTQFSYHKAKTFMLENKKDASIVPCWSRD